MTRRGGIGGRSGILVVALLAAAGGCGGGTGSNGHKPDAAPDAPEVAAPDAPGDTTPDAPIEVAADAPADTTPDIPIDAIIDTATDAPAEESGDVPPETGADATGETGPDALTEVAAEAAPDYDAGTGCVGPGDEAPLVPADAALPAAGLVLWVRADRGIYKTAQSDVCAWRDQSGHGNDLHPPSGRPTWEATAVGGKPAVHHQAVGHDLETGLLGIGATSGRTFIAVSQLVTANGRFHPIIQGQGGTPGIYIGIDANTWMTAGSREGAYLTSNSFDTALATSTSPRLHVLAVSTMTPGAAIATALSYRVDGAAQTLTVKAGLSGGVIQSFANANFTSVGDVSGTPSAGVAYGDAYVAEAIIYDRALTSNEVTAVEAALKARYGIP